MQCLSSSRLNNWRKKVNHIALIHRGHRIRYLPSLQIQFINTVCTATNILKKCYILWKKSKLDQGKIMGMSLYGRVPAEKLGHGQFFFLLSHLVGSSNCLGQINHTSTECLQLWWPLRVSERVCTFFLQLFTQLED